MSRIVVRFGFLLLGMLMVCAPVQADPISPEAAPAVNKAVAYIQSRATKGNQLQLGEAALLALALEKADVPASDPSLRKLIEIVLSYFNSTELMPGRKGGTDIYEASVTIMALGNFPGGNYRAQIESAANYILNKQKGNGSWDYNHRDFGDTSISQYALLGLWEADIAGVSVGPGVWDRAAGWYMSVQKPSGGWVYHSDEVLHTETVSMTAAGVGSLLLCNRQLEPYRKADTEHSKLLTPLGGGTAVKPKYKPGSSVPEINACVRRGLSWLASSFSPSTDGLQGTSVYYGLYGIERAGALADLRTLGGQDWYAKGLQFILSSQRGDGTWDTHYGPECETAWAVLFMTKSTKKSVQRVMIKKLGAGTLLGGKGLPKDLSQLTIAQGRVVVRPMNGAVDEMLTVLEDPRAVNAENALEGLLTRYQKDGPAALKPFKDRFRNLLKNKDQGVRALGAWALARTTDLDVIPDLISVLTDADDGVVSSAKIGLQLLSRKIDGFGPAPGATPEQKEAAAAKWREWFDSVRPPALDGRDDLAESPLRVDLSNLGKKK